MSKFVQNILSPPITETVIPKPILPPLPSSTIYQATSTILFTLLPTTPPSSPRLLRQTDNEIRIKTSEIVFLMLVLIVMLLLLIWILILMVNFSVRYLTGSLERKKKRRGCGGGHEEDGLCRKYGRGHTHFDGYDLKDGEGIKLVSAVAVDGEGVGEVPGGAVARRRSAE